MRISERRQSKKRDAILELIRSSKTHPTAQWVYERLKGQFPDLSLGTVYRNIKVLTGEGALTSLGVVHGEERFDGIPALHSHAICTRCGQIVDLDETISSRLSAPLPNEINGFAIDLRKTVFYGLCGGCKTGVSTETTALGR